MLRALICRANDALVERWCERESAEFAKMSADAECALCREIAIIRCLIHDDTTHATIHHCLLRHAALRAAEDCLCHAIHVERRRRERNRCYAKTRYECANLPLPLLPRYYYASAIDEIRASSFHAKESRFALRYATGRYCRHDEDCPANRRYVSMP